MELDFTQPAAQDEAYDPAVARKCFESFGRTEVLAEMECFFTEGQVSNKMYLLVEGEVSLTRAKKTLDIVRPGEIFGEIAVITQQPRSATAMARKPCQVLVLDAAQFQKALQSTPEFALMLMNIMNNRLRKPTRKKMWTTHHSIHASQPCRANRFVAITASARPIVAMFPLSQ